MAFGISVIVPAYNAANFLERCANSVLSQSETAWELLIVENGSTDDTTAVAEQLAQRDVRIRVLHSEKGVSNARNLGIEQAVFAYTTFLDADDWLAPGCFAFFREMAQAYPDCDLITGETDRQAGSDLRQLYGQDAIEQARVLFLRQPTRYLTVWGKLYRTARLQESAVRFDPALTHAEDSDYLIRLLRECSQVLVTDQPVYHYYINPESAVHGGQSGLLQKYSRSLECTEQALAAESEAVQEAFLFYVLDNLLVLLVHDTFRPKQPAREQFRQATEVLETPVFRDALERAPLGQAPLIKRVVFSLAKGRRLRLLRLAVAVRQWQNRHRQ